MNVQWRAVCICSILASPSQLPTRELIYTFRFQWGAFYRGSAHSFTQSLCWHLILSCNLLTSTLNSACPYIAPGVREKPASTDELVIPSLLHEKIINLPKHGCGSWWSRRREVVVCEAAFWFEVVTCGLGRPFWLCTEKDWEFAERHFPKPELYSGDEVCELFYPLSLQGQVG